MKNQKLFVLVIGFISTASYVFAQSVTDDPVFLENIDTEIKQEDIGSNQAEQNEVLNIITDIVEEKPYFQNAHEISLAEPENVLSAFATDRNIPSFEDTSGVVALNPTVSPYAESLSNNEFNLQEPEDDIDVEIVPIREDDYHYTDVIQRDPNEIMNTAAGFVPIPIFKRRQKPRKQVATRRRFKTPYPYRRFYYFYPYYNFYRPSSLRFF